MKNNYLKTSHFYPITTVCLITFLLCFISVKLSVFLGLILSFWLIMRAKPDGILGLFLLYFSRYFFYYVINIRDASGTASYGIRDVLTFAGFPLEVETLACLYFSLRVLIEGFFYPETYRKKFPAILFPLWVLAFVPVLIGLYWALDARSINWTGGIRYLMITGSYFYGYILAKNWPKGKNELLLPIFLPLITIILMLMNLCLFWSHHGFLFLGMGGAFSIYFMRKKILKYRFLGVLLFCLSVGYAMRGSLTMMLTVILSFFFSYLGTKKRKASLGLRSQIAKFSGNMAILGILFFTAYVCYQGFEPDYDPTAMYGSYVGTTMERIEAKVMSDRLPLWTSALNQILSGENLIVSYSRPLEVPGHANLWLVSSHSTILEALRVNGLFSGMVMLVILFVALKNSLFVLEKSADPILKSLAAAVLGVAIAGITLNVIPINMTMGFWLWSLAGLCHGLFVQDSLVAENELLPPVKQSQTSEEVS